MRIIAGSFRSRTLSAPSGQSTRPTSDRLRETLFNVLAPRISGAHFLDLYAGSGAVGIEALSRSAAQVEFVERSPAALSVLRANLASLRVNSGFRVHSSSVGAWLRKSQALADHGEETRQRAEFDLIFLDPPYDADQEYSATLELLGARAAARLAPEALVIAEHRRNRDLAGRYGVLQRTRLLKQGDAWLSFFSIAAPDREGSPAEAESKENP